MLCKFLTVPLCRSTASLGFTHLAEMCSDMARSLDVRLKSSRELDKVSLYHTHNLPIFTRKMPELNHHYLKPLQHFLQTCDTLLGHCSFHCLTSPRLPENDPNMIHICHPRNIFLLRFIIKDSIPPVSCQTQSSATGGSSRKSNQGWMCQG